MVRPRNLGAHRTWLGTGSETLPLKGDFRTSRTTTEALRNKGVCFAPPCCLSQRFKGQTLTGSEMFPYHRHRLITHGYHPYSGVVRIGSVMFPYWYGEFPNHPYHHQILQDLALGLP